MTSLKDAKIAFDLDGVLADKPPLVPKALLEYLFRGKTKKYLHYRYPKAKAEINLRKFSHFYLFRPPIKRNIVFLKRIKEAGAKVYLVSSRYSFLKEETRIWLKKRGLANTFEEIFLNLKDEQPHLFKEKVLREIKPDFYLEDDRSVVDYLKRKISSRLILIKGKGGEELRKIFSLKKRILFTLTYDEPNISGVTIYARRLAKALAKRGYQTTLFSAAFREGYPRERKEEGIRIVREKVHWHLGKGVLMFGLPLSAFREVEKADVVVCHLPQLEAIVWSLIAKLKRRPLFLIYHADLLGWLGWVNKLGVLLANISHLISAVLADKIVASTKDYAFRSYFLKHFKRKLVFIYPPVVTAKPSSFYQNFLKKKLAGVEIKIGFAGRIAREKGICYLIKTIPYLKKKGVSFKIVFAGPDKIVGENYREEIKNLINKYQDYLLFLGRLSQSQISSFFKTIDVLVLPSTMESFGLVQVEAMLNGCPVVASNLPGIRVPVRVTKMGRLVTSKDSYALAKAIFTVVSRRKEYVEKRKKAKEVFSFSKAIDCHEELFN